MARALADSGALPLLGNTASVKSTTETAIDKIFSIWANLTQLLPTTTVLVFQVLLPTFSDGGSCYTANKYLTGFLLGLCAISCSFAPFTDSYKASDGTLYYGIATRTGLWTLNSQINKTVDLSSYKLKFLDFVHSLLSVLVFGSVAFMNSDVVNCYYADVGVDAKQLVINLPLGVGFVCSLAFLALPTTRNGIGYPAAT
jgi:hypothetical protein